MVANEKGGGIAAARASGLRAAFTGVGVGGCDLAGCGVPERGETAEPDPAPKPPDSESDKRDARGDGASIGTASDQIRSVSTQQIASHDLIR